MIVLRKQAKVYNIYACIYSDVHTKMISLNNITHTYKIINHRQFISFILFIYKKEKWQNVHDIRKHTQHEQTWVSFYEDEFTLKWWHNALLGLWIFLDILAHNVFHLHIKIETITFNVSFEIHVFGLERHIKLLKQSCIKSKAPMVQMPPVLVSMLQQRQHTCIATKFIIVHQTQCTCRQMSTQ